MVRIILIRHGETTWNVEGRYQGQEDIPLSPKGIAQGKAVGLALKDISIDAAVSGPVSYTHLDVYKRQYYDASFYIAFQFFLKYGLKLDSCILLFSLFLLSCGRERCPLYLPSRFSLS